MPLVSFTPQLREHAPDQPVAVEGATVGEALARALSGRERLRTYLFDEHGRLRRHVAVFVDGALVADRVTLGDPVADHSEVYVMQALSGG